MTSLQIKLEKSDNNNPFDGAYNADNNNVVNRSEENSNGDENLNVDKFEDYDEDEGGDNRSEAVSSGINATPGTLKRKRIADLTYNAEAVFDNHQEATQYVDSLGLWKFERTRKATKGTKAFYNCRMSAVAVGGCKAKIYLCLDPHTSRVTFYQNNLPHTHDLNASFDTNAKKYTHSVILSNNYNNNSNNNNNNNNEGGEDEDDEENNTVDIINENDFENSYVDFGYNETNENNQEAEMTDGNGQVQQQQQQNNLNWFDTSMNQKKINNNNNNNNNTLNSTLSKTEHNYSIEKVFNSLIEAEQFLETVYTGMWKFERTRPTKKGSKGFYHCKLSKNCKSKIYLLSQTIGEEICLYKNNIEHDHTNSTSTPSAALINPLAKNKLLPKLHIDYSPKIFMNDYVNVNSNSNNTEINNQIHDQDDDNNNNNSSQNDTALDADQFSNHDEEPFNTTTGNSMQVPPLPKKARRSLTTKRIEVAYTAQEKFQTHFLAEKFIESLSIWKFQRTRRDTKAGPKQFYGCKLSKECKAKIYIFQSDPESDVVTVYRNNLDHDHTQTLAMIGSATNIYDNTNANLIRDDYLNEESSSNNIESGFASVESLPTKETSENSYLNDTEAEEDTMSTTTSSSNANPSKKSFDLESYYTPAETFESRDVAQDCIDSNEMWKFVKTRSSKHGSRDFYECKHAEYSMCRAKVYLLSQPNFGQFILYKNSIEHDHRNRDSQRLRENQNSVNFCDNSNLKSSTAANVNAEDMGPLKYFINTNHNNQNLLDENEDEYDDDDDDIDNEFDNAGGQSESDNKLHII
jgi:hypothetical protein